MSENNTLKPIVVYLACKPLGIEYLKSFVKNYKYFDSGYDHDLIICFKQFGNYKELDPWKKEISLKFIEFYDDNIQMDYDIGSYLRIAKNYPKRKILSWVLTQFQTKKIGSKFLLIIILKKQ